MTGNHRKEVAWIAAAFLLLIAVSAYRQISMRLIPDDPVRPVLVYVVYLLLLSIWWRTIYNRITQHNMRVFLLWEHAVMLVGITGRFIQDALLYQDTYLMRVSGYLLIIPFALLPLFGLYASFGLGKSEEHHHSPYWYFLLIPAITLIALVLTNERHHLVFRVLESETQPNLYFHPNVGIYVTAVWILTLLLARIFLIFHRSRELEGPSHWKSAPLLFAIFMVVLTLPHLALSFVVNLELIEYSVFMFFLEVMVWESSIIVGMVPVNTQYEEVFDRSTVAMQIVEEDGHPYQKSACAPDLSAELFDLLRQQTTYRTPEGQEMHLHAIHGGYAVWQSDVSQTVAVISALEKSAEKLEYDGELLRQELKLRSDEAAVREQNQIYNHLTDEIAEQLQLLRNLLGKREWVSDKDKLFHTICLIGTYIKRRCSLRLIEQSDKQISNGELTLCYDELIACLGQMGVKAGVMWHTAKTPHPEFAIFTLDVFEYLLEYERFDLHSIQLCFETETAFSVQVHSDSASSGQFPTWELGRIDRENYHMSWQALEQGYQISFCCGGD